ncbi:dihydrofolate reductase family protein [Massilia terrae]|uniref:Dihydrofolate reductase family protein n=1 Tax=Massilia terrae TaxID=1811224 RepID=A0ABT2CTY3_9BURK|nr:dihydrofolate reductase family protein [Massilia terrae]MCS0657433.1 dihydrofolate reductase family protein [Massilia terrae]
MSELKVRSFTISLDGFGAGPNQTLENPMGERGGTLHQWFRGTRTFQTMIGNAGKGTDGADEDFAARGFENIGAWILGRNMFGPVRGPWPDDSWKGWWGDEPPYHVPVYVLTHYPREPLEMKGGTTFYFVTDGIQSAYDQAMKAANGKDVRLGGGVETVREYLRAGLLDEMHLAISPVLLGSGENLFEGLDLAAMGFRCTEHVPTAAATHVVLRKD